MNFKKIFLHNKHKLILVFFILVYVIYFTTASFLRHDNFYTGRFDLGNMDQTVWNTINGRIFQTSGSGGIISRLSSHADFMLILLSPFYLIWSHPKMLLLIQSLIIGLGGIFVYLIAKHVLKNKNFAFIFGLSYLINPFVQFTNLYDFHAVTIATTTLLASFYFLMKKKYLLLTIFLILSGITKEQVWVITSLFGFPLIFQKSKKIKLLGCAIIFISLAIFAYLIWYAIPSNLGRQHFALSYYSNFGNSPTQVVSNVLFSPQKLLSIIFEESRIEYLKHIFMPVGFLSLIAPLYLVFSVPDLLINLLSNNPNLHQIYYQYTATITPFIFISSIFTTQKLLKWSPKMKSYLVIYIMFFSILSSYLYGPLPGSKNPNTDMFTKPQPKKEIMEDFLSKIPKEYVVAATNNLGAHVSHRSIVYTIPVGIEKADIVVFLLNDSFAQPSLDDQRKIVEDLKRNKNYIEVLNIDDFVVFKKQ